MIHLLDGVLSVRSDVSAYVIEPARHDLGLSRVAMVDYHLEQIADVHARAVDGAKYGPDLDALLDARSYFAQVAS